MTALPLKLYIYGRSHSMNRTVDVLRQACEQTLNGQYELVVIDVMEHPEYALEDQIIATPTLVREQPLPPRRVIGDMLDIDNVLSALNLHTDSAMGETRE